MAGYRVKKIEIWHSVALLENRGCIFELVSWWRPFPGSFPVSELVLWNACVILIVISTAVVYQSVRSRGPLVFLVSSTRQFEYAWSPVPYPDHTTTKLRYAVLIPGAQLILLILGTVCYARIPGTNPLLRSFKGTTEIWTIDGENVYRTANYVSTFAYSEDTISCIWYS